MFACESAVTIVVYYCCGCPGGPSLSLRPCRLPTSSRLSPSSVPVTPLIPPQEGRRHCHCRRLSAAQEVASSVPADQGGRCRRRRLTLLPREVVVSVTIVCLCCTEVAWSLLPLPSPVSAAQEVAVVVVIVSARNVDGTETHVHMSSMHLDKLSTRIRTCTALTRTSKRLQTKQKSSERVETSRKRNTHLMDAKSR